MTLRKILILFDEYKRANGTYQEPKGIDEIIPF